MQEVADRWLNQAITLLKRHFPVAPSMFLFQSFLFLVGVEIYELL